MHSDQNVKNTDGFTRDVIQRLLTLNYWRWFVLRRRRCHEVTEVVDLLLSNVNHVPVLFCKLSYQFVPPSLWPPQAVSEQ